MFIQKRILLTISFIIFHFAVFAQMDTTVYTITIKNEMVEKVGKEVMGMTIDGSIPGPTLRFMQSFM